MTRAEPKSEKSDGFATLGERYDRSNMADVIRGVPDQVDFALNDPSVPKLGSRSFARVVVAGMGGSSLPLDVLADAFRDRFLLPVEVVRDFRVPCIKAEGTLVVAVSFSGNTEETLNVARYTCVPPEDLVVLTSGGVLADLADRNKHPMIRIPVDREPRGFQPRCATGYIATYLARVLVGAAALPPIEDEFGSLVPFLRALDIRGEAEALARWIGSRIPAFYAESRYAQSAARVAKIKFNENAKMPAFFGALPEVNHNEMIGFSRAVGEFALVYLRDPAGDPRIDRRFETMRAVFDEKQLKHVSFRDWTMPGSSSLQRIFGALAFADWASYSTALLAKTDPTPVSLVEEFKLRLQIARGRGFARGKKSLGEPATENASRPGEGIVRAWVDQ